MIFLGKPSSEFMLGTKLYDYETGELVVYDDELSLSLASATYDIAIVEGNRFTCEETFKRGEEVLFITGNSIYESIITDVGLGNEYSFQADRYPDIDVPPTLIKHKNNILSATADAVAGVYYTDMGQIVIIGIGFNIKDQVSYRKIYARHPELNPSSNQANIKYWELDQAILTAYEEVMSFIDKYDEELGEKYTLLKTGEIIELIVLGVLAIHESKILKDVGTTLTYVEQYGTAITNYRPAYRIDKDATVPKPKEKDSRPKAWGPV